MGVGGEGKRENPPSQKRERENVDNLFWDRSPLGNQTARTHERNETNRFPGSSHPPTFDLKGYALCRRPLLGHCGCQKLSFERPGASNLAPLPLGTIWAPCGHPGGPFEQQEGHVEVRNQIFSDLGMISRLHIVSFFGFRWVKFFFVCFGLVSRLPFASIFDSKSRRLGLPKPGFRIESIAETIFSQKSSF